MFGTRLKELREKQKLSQRQLAKLLKISPSSVAMYELNQRSPDKEMIALMAKLFQVPSDYLLGIIDDPTPYLNSEPNGSEQGDVVLPLGETKEIPIFNLQPKNRDEIFAQDNIIGMEPVPAGLMATIAIKVNDDSMSGSRIHKGDRVIIREQNKFIDGQTVLAQISDRSLVIRRATKTNDGIILSPDNSAYQPQHFKEKDLIILGIVVQVNFDYT